MTELLCPWQAPQFLFYSTDPGIPPLLYYSYIPIIFVSLFFAIFVFIKDNHSLRSKLLLLITIFFNATNLNALFEWTSVNPFTQMFSWQLTGLLELPISLLAVYFVYVFLEGNRISFKFELLLSLLYIPTVILLPTKLNVQQFYLTDSDCGGVPGVLWQYIYSLEILTIFAIAYLCWRKYRMLINTDNSLKLHAVFLGISSVLFLGVSNASYIFGDLTKIYQINLIGPVGLLLFICTLAYMIVKYRIFNIKLFATQALVIGTAFLIGARLFYSTTTTGFILSAATLGVFLISGIFLIRSVKREIEQRELIQKQEQELEVVNEQQESLLHFISHEVKGYLTKSQAGFASIIEGDYGVVAEPLKTMAESALGDVRKGVKTVMEILDASNLKKGTMSYVKKPFDFKALVTATVEHLKPAAEEKHLTIQTTIGDGQFTIEGDEEKIKEHMVRNLIDNAIKYTPAGTIDIELAREANTLRFSVKDSGVGITPEDMSRLFTEGGKGKDSIKTNVHSTGYGLFIAKEIVDAHSGKIWAESEGAGKGSQFIVELPMT